MATQHDKLVYILSALGRKQDNRVMVSLKNDEEKEGDKSRLPFLDHLALILVTKATGDVAATALVQTPTKIRILYS